VIAASVLKLIERLTRDNATEAEGGIQRLARVAKKAVAITTEESAYRGTFDNQQTA